MARHRFLTVAMFYESSVWTIFFALSLFAALCPVPLIRASQLEMKQRFLAEGPVKWGEYSAKIEAVHGTVTVLLKKEGKTVQHIRSLRKRNNTCKIVSWQDLLEDSTSPASGRGDVWAFNGKYAFHLQRKKETAPWLVKELVMEELGQINAVAKEFERTGGERSLRCLIQAHSEALSDLVSSPNFVVLSAESFIYKNASAIKIHFDNAHPMEEPGRKFSAIQSGTLVLDPANYWCLLSNILRCKSLNAESTIEEEFEFDRTASFPVPKRYTIARTVDHAKFGKLFDTWELAYDLKEPLNQLPDLEFTLSAFGFPEPVGVVWAKPVKWWLWLIVGAVGLAGLGFLSHKLKRRYQSSRSSSI